MPSLYSIRFNEIIGINYCKYLIDHDIVFGHVLMLFIYYYYYYLKKNNGETNAIGLIGIKQKQKNS